MLPALALSVALAAITYTPPAGPSLNLRLDLSVVGPLPLPQDEVARHAAAGLGKLGFRYAGVGPDGHAWGYADEATVAVLGFPQPDGRTQLMLCVAAWTPAEAARVRDAVRSHLTDARPDPLAPAAVGTPLPQVFRKSPPLHWRADTRPVSPVAG